MEQSRSSSRRKREVAPTPLSFSHIQIFHRGTSEIMKKKNFVQLNTTSPFVYLIKDFLSEKEIQHLESHCEKNANNFCTSFTEDDSNQEVFDERRTSTFIYLKKAQDVMVRGLEARAAALAGLPSENVEPLQIVSYTKGQYFDLHHDAGTFDDEALVVNVVPPRRIITLFCYLNTLPEGQGHTEFPYLGVSVRPTRGCAVMFCNLLPDGSADYRTSHQADPVTEENLRKTGMNIWIGDSSFQSLAMEGPSRKKKKRAPAKVEGAPVVVAVAAS